MPAQSSLVRPKTLRNGGFLWGAHHPHCERHHHHLLWIKGHPFCLGCVCMYTGIILGIPLSLLSDWRGIGIPTWIVLHWIMLLPTLMQVRIQKKSFKMFARTILGVTISSYFLSGLFHLQAPINIWIFRLLLVGVFLLFWKLIKSFRNRYTKSPCDNCPLGYFPTCEWNLPNLLAEIDDAEFHKAIASDKIQNLIVK